MNINCFEKDRVKSAQENFEVWCKNNLPVGRMSTKEDWEGHMRVLESIDRSRDKIFGSSDWIWYLKVVKGV